MADPLFELQREIVLALKIDPTIAALVGARVIDGRPDAFPAISVGPSDYVPLDLTCIDARVVSLQLDCWIRDSSMRFNPLYALTGAVKAALHDASLVLDDHALAKLLVTQVRHFRDPDGLTLHGVVALEAVIEER